MDQRLADAVPDDIAVRVLSMEGHAVPYYGYCPPDSSVTTPVMIAVHGITRNSLELLDAFLPRARQHGFVLIVPHFSQQQFPDYQRLGVRGSGLRADKVLQAILSDMGTHCGRPMEKVSFFGFSGGAQFCHRFAMLRPLQIERMVLASAGWYTFPDLGERFPFGLNPRHPRRDMKFVLPDLLAVPTLVTVGEADNARDTSLRRSAEVDARQGLTRVERGRRWIRCMAAAARHYNLHDIHQFQSLPGVGHEFMDCAEHAGLADLTIDFLKLNMTVGPAIAEGENLGTAVKP